MFPIDEQNAEPYLRRTGWIAPGERVHVRALPGGVSNQVLYVQRPDQPAADFVVKQARAQLRTPAPWFCGLERIWREVDVLELCREVLADVQTDDGPGALAVVTPRVLGIDRENYAFAMTAAPLGHRVWKADLLAGRADKAIAAACGQVLARLHAATWHNPAVAERFGDRQVFDELRLDPYYRTLSRAFPENAAALDRLVDSVWQNRHSLVHADFSPKNLLVHDAGLLLVDFETGHYGDPAFDLGFFLSHLVLKAAFHSPDFEPCLSLTRTFWQSYRECLLPRIGPEQYAALERRAVQNFAGCGWARLDGTSRIDYLADMARREAVRSLCRKLLAESPATWNEVLEQVVRRFAGFSGAVP